MAIFIKEIKHGKIRTHSDFMAKLEEEKRQNVGVKPVIVNNGTVTLKTKAINKIKSITVDKKPIKPNEITTYTVELDNSNKDTIIKDLGLVRFCFWLQKKNSKNAKITVPIKLIKGQNIYKTKKPKVKVVAINSKGSLSSLDHNIDFTNEEDSNLLSENIAKYTFFYADINIDEEKKIVTLKIKYSKWMDNYQIRVEGYFKNDEIKGDGADTTISRYVKSPPEIIDAYWLNAEGRKTINTGYKQDVYLHLSTLGLKGKTLEILVFDSDIYHNPPPFVKTDDPIVWKNNKIKIDKREINKQFKVGDKKRYEEAQSDESTEKNIFEAFVDYSGKVTYDLDLYINIKNGEDLGIRYLKSKYGQLNLTAKEKIISTFFAKTETEAVQADTLATKKTKTPKTKVPFYEKLNKGVLGQKIKLVASCTNLDGKEVIFKIYEKRQLLVSAYEELPVMQKDTTVTEIKATVKDGYAVAEIELKHCKNQADNKDWLDLLKNGYDDDDNKTANLYVKITCKGEINHDKDFLENSPFKMISNNWHEPIKNPQRNKYNYYGDEKPKSSAFGKVRNEEKKYHQGLDIFAIPGTTIYACLDGKVVEKRVSSSVGNVITIEINQKKEIVNRRIESNYSFDFPSTGNKGEKEKGSSFDLNDNSKIYVRHYHLSKVNVAIGDKVEAGSAIGKSGVTGNAHLTRAPHLHIEILDTTEYTYELKDKINPAYFVDLKTIDNSVQDESVKYKYNKNGTKKKV